MAHLHPSELGVAVSVVVVGAGLITSDCVRLPVSPWESLTLTMNGKAPPCVGVPKRIPAELRLMPEGSEPVSENVYCPLPPVTRNGTGL